MKQCWCLGSIKAKVEKNLVSREAVEAWRRAVKEEKGRVDQQLKGCVSSRLIKARMSKMTCSRSMISQ